MSAAHSAFSLHKLLPCLPVRRSVASASVTGSQRFRISIKPAEEAGTTPRGDSVSLRNAVQVGGPSLGCVTFEDAGQRCLLSLVRDLLVPLTWAVCDNECKRSALMSSRLFCAMLLVASGANNPARPIDNPILFAQGLRLGGLGSFTGGSSADSTPFGTSRAASVAGGPSTMLRSASGVSCCHGCCKV